MENMAYAVPGQPALAFEYNKVVNNVNELGRGTLCRRYASTAQPIPDREWTRVEFPTPLDSCPHVSVNAGGDILTINTPGVYDIDTSVRFSSNSTGARHLVIGAGTSSWQNIRYRGCSVPAGGDSFTPAAAVSIRLQEGDTVAVWVYQSSGGFLNTSPSGEIISLSIRYCGES